MDAIIKAKETMTARERVWRTFAFEKTDRVTIGYDANPFIHQKLCKALGVNPKNHLELFDVLGVDYVGIEPKYTGPKLFQEMEGRTVNPLEGYVMRWIENQSGGYWDFCDFPLQGAEEQTFYAYPVPNPDDYDYDALLARIKFLDNKYALYIGGPGCPDIINGNARLMGMEDILCHLITENEAVLDFVQRRVQWQLNVFERTLEKCKGHIEFMWLGEDLGTQIAPIISLELYRKIFKPIHKQFADLASAYHIPSLMHTCGSSNWAYEDLIEIGIKGVDTLQPEAVRMSPEYLGKHFGGRLNFRGCISTAGALAYGTVQEVEQVCKETLEILMPYRGYHFAPTHQIQDNSPVENIIKMYQSVHQYGCY